MKDNTMDILGLQEAKVANNGQERRKGYTWYFSGEQRTRQARKDCDSRRFDAGVGIIIRNEYRNSVDKIIPINDRIIIMTMRFAIHVSIKVAYAPTANSEDYEKNDFYDQFEKHTFNR